MSKRSAQRLCRVGISDGSRRVETCRGSMRSTYSAARLRREMHSTWPSPETPPGLRCHDGQWRQVQRPAGRHRRAGAPTMLHLVDMRIATRIPVTAQCLQPPLPGELQQLIIGETLKLHHGTAAPITPPAEAVPTAASTGCSHSPAACAGAIPRQRASRHNSMATSTSCIRSRVLPPQLQAVRALRNPLGGNQLGHRRMILFL